MGDMWISPAINPSFLFILAFNSLAAFSVKVVTKMVLGSMFLSLIR
jgi:hypothetical protein